MARPAPRFGGRPCAVRRDQDRSIATRRRGQGCLGVKRLTAPLVLLVATPLLAAPPADPRFNAWDENGDGKLFPEEVPQRLRTNFARVDRDGDGAISPEELRAFIPRRAVPDPDKVGTRGGEVETRRISTTSAMGTRGSNST